MRPFVRRWAPAFLNLPISTKMPVERRRIIFSEDEVISAMLNHCRHSGIPLPDAEVEGLDIAMEEDCSVALTFAVTSPEEPDEVCLDAETVLNAVIGFCRMRSIPLPRAAIKRLEPMKGDLSMVFDMRRTSGWPRRSLAA